MMTIHVIYIFDFWAEHWHASYSWPRKLSQKCSLSKHIFASEFLYETDGHIDEQDH